MMETSFGASLANGGARARGRSFQDKEFHSPPGSEKVSKFACIGQLENLSKQFCF